MNEDANIQENTRQTAVTPLRCLIVVPSLIRAGAETQAVDLANGLAARGHSIHLCSFESQLDQKARISDDVRFHHLPRNSKYDRTLIARLAPIIDQERIDIVQGVQQIATLVAFLAAKRSRARPPVVSAIHTTINRGLKEELHDRLLYRRVFRRLPAVVFVCEHQRNHWVRKYPELAASSRVVHNGVAPERFRRHEFEEPARRLRAELDIPDGAFVFASIAAFRPEKGHKLLIDAFARVGNNAWLVFAGDGDLRAGMESYAAEAGLTGRVRFLGNVSDTRPLIAASNATVLASTAVETFSMAMLESMAMGVPMIAPRIGGLSEAIIDGETGLLFPIGDVPALSRHMQSVVEHPSAVITMGRAAEQKLIENFTVDKMIAKSERVLHESLHSS